MSPADFWRRFGAVDPGSGHPNETPVDVDEWMKWFTEEGKKKRG
jgi:hypothetical protein